MCGCCLGRILMSMHEVVEDKWELGETRTITALHWAAEKRQHPSQAVAAQLLRVYSPPLDIVLFVQSRLLY